MIRILFPTLFLALCAGDIPSQAADEATPGVTDHDVIPRLLLRCTVCHGTRRQEGDLDLRTKASMLKGGKSGPAMVPGDADNSLLLQKVLAGEMPPKSDLVKVSVKPMPTAEVELLKQWITAGAPESGGRADIATADEDPLVSDGDREFWSFQTPTRPEVPAVNHADRVRHPIDAFILKKLEDHGLTFSPDANKTVLIRRVYFDLTGLPPSSEEVEEFLADDGPQAYERLVDRVLESPRYGERWGQHWLDAVGYSDSEGVTEQDDLRPLAYRYRDYVIRAFNADKPYDRFLLEQIAGDELEPYDLSKPLIPSVYDNLVATGFLRMVPDGTTPGITGFVRDRLEVIDSAMEVLSSTVLGLTMGCARCHSHKFDPIPQRDYYRLTAVFKGALDEHDWLKPQPLEGTIPRYLDFVAKDGSPDHGAQRNAQSITRLESRVETIEGEQRKKLIEERLSTLPEEDRQALRDLIATPVENRNSEQIELAAKYEKELDVATKPLGELGAKFPPDYKEIKSELKLRQMGARPMIRALWDRGEPSPSYMLDRGVYTSPGALVGPGVPSALTDGRTPLDLQTPWPGAKKTGRRLAFARWLTSGKHPLTARVLVNRIWRHHFDRGIVHTLDNFGKTGTAPTHPQLLDWLAVEFMERGWSVKELHRGIMKSSVYQQSSLAGNKQRDLDPDNELWSRAPFKRLEAEALRDTLLLVSGKLDLTPFGPADAVNMHRDGLITARPMEGSWRRSIYLLHRRTQPETFLETYDRPRMGPNCIERNISIVAPQALHLLNDRMIHELSAAFSERVLSEAGEDQDRRIKRAYRLAFQRPPNAEEVDEARAFLGKVADMWKSAGEVASGVSPEAKALANLCHALINSAEFLYID